MAESSIVGGELVPAVVDGAKVEPARNLVDGYVKLLDARAADVAGAQKYAEFSVAQKDAARNALCKTDKELAAMLVKRDASNLAETLEPLVGEDVARYIFGFGVLGMAMNAVLMNMLICGLCFSEIFKRGGNAKWQIGGSSLILLSAVASVFFKGARMWLVIYAGVMAAVLLPIAYGAFVFLINSKKVLGGERPKGGARVVWNVLMACSLAASSVASIWVLYQKIGVAGPVLFVAFFALVVASAVLFKNKKH